MQKTCWCRVVEGGRGRGCLFSAGTRSVKIRRHLVILLMSFVALSDHTQRASTVNNGGKCNYSQSNYSSQLCFAWRMTLKQQRPRDGAPCRWFNVEVVYRCGRLLSADHYFVMQLFYWCVLKSCALDFVRVIFASLPPHYFTASWQRGEQNWLEQKHLMGLVQCSVVVAVQLVQRSSLSK